MDYFLLFFIGLTATTLGTLAGGGGLISFPAMLLMGIPVHAAIGANKVSNTFSSFSSFFYLLKKKEVSMRESLWIFPVSLGGGITGGLIATQLTEPVMHLLAVILLTIALVLSFITNNHFSGTKPLRLNFKSSTGLYAIGMYDGLFGPGQGTLMLYLFNHLNISYVRAVGLVRLATFSSCFGAAITYISTDKIIWPLTIALLAGSLSGAQIGVRLAQKLNTKYVNPLLRIVTIALIVRMSVEYFFNG